MFVADVLLAAVIAVAGLAERPVARVTKLKLNGDPPAFLTRGEVGLDSGLIGAQVSASAVLAEMRSRAMPASILSISTSAASQDVVSMGTIAGRATVRRLDDAAAILTIQAPAVVQGVDNRRTATGEDGFASPTDAPVRAIRKLSPPLLQDPPLSARSRRWHSGWTTTIRTWRCLVSAIWAARRRRR